MKFTYFFIAILLLLSGSVKSQWLDSIRYPTPDERLPADAPTIVKGRQLFSEHCSSCHMISHELVGPALASIDNKRPISWLHRFIRNSQEVINSGDAYAIALYGRYNYQLMPPFEFFSDEDINSILAYIRKSSTADFPVAGANPKVDMDRYDGPAIDALSVNDVLSTNLPEKTTVVEPKSTLMFLVVMYVLVGISVVVLVLLSIKIFKGVK